MRARGFTLRIDLGNEAMQTSADVAEAVRRLASRLLLRPNEVRGTFMEGDGAPSLVPEVGDRWRIEDRNGNKVGEARFTRGRR